MDGGIERNAAAAGPGMGESDPPLHLVYYTEYVPVSIMIVLIILSRIRRGFMSRRGPHSAWEEPFSAFHDKNIKINLPLPPLQAREAESIFLRAL